MRRITGALQHYSWGQLSAIAELRCVAPSGRPEAEYWLGAHPRGPSRVVDDNGEVGPMLESIIAAEPEHWLGPGVRDRFGELPFLFKVLAAAEPLSIQAHPNAEQARAGFEREDLAGVDRDDVKRSYRDPNHKPELICALSVFEAKCGFRDLDETRRLFSLFVHPALQPLQERLGADDEPSAVIGDVVAWLLDLDRIQVVDLVEGVVSEVGRLLDPAVEPSPMVDFRPDLDWTLRINEVYPADIGVVLALLLNHLTLRPGEALFLEAGVVHAYLHGLGVELMANSDNVLRCGLTHKHIDVDELQAVATFEPHRPPVQTTIGPSHRFDSPVPEFSLTVYRSVDDVSRRICDVEGPEIVFAESGSATLSSTTDGSGDTLRLSPGEAVAVPAATGRYEVVLDGADTRVWRASVGR